MAKAWPDWGWVLCGAAITYGAVVLVSYFYEKSQGGTVA